CLNFDKMLPVIFFYTGIPSALEINCSFLDKSHILAESKTQHIIVTLGLGLYDPFQFQWEFIFF
ncbi:unnamed protein product, partial [Bubo scandiacus]